MENYITKRAEMTKLFQTTKQNISLHINNIDQAVCRKQTAFLKNL